MNVIKQYKKWSNHIDPISLIQSVKKYYCLNNNNCCLIIMDYNEYVIIGNQNINKIMKYIVKRLKNILFDYNYYYVRNIPIYILLIQNDILFNFLLNETNYNYNLLLQPINTIKDEDENNLMINKHNNILSFVYDKYKNIPIDELNKKIELLKNNSYPNKIFKIPINNKISIFCKNNKIKDIYMKKTCSYYYNLLNKYQFDNIKVFEDYDVFSLSLALLNIKPNDKINNFIIKFINNLIKPSSYYSYLLHVSFYLLNYYCKVNNLKINYNNFNIIQIYNINDILNIYEIFYKKINNPINIIKYKDINCNLKKVNKYDYQIFYNYIKISNNELNTIFPKLKKYFKDKIYYISEKIFINQKLYFNELKNINQFNFVKFIIINQNQYNNLDKLYNNLKNIKLPLELLKIFELCFTTYKNTNYDFSYIGLKLFLQKKYNINLYNDYITNTIEIINYYNNNILKKYELYLNNNLIYKDNNNINLDNLKYILKSQDCIFEIHLNNYIGNEFKGHSCKLYFDHKYKEIYFIIPEGYHNTYYNIIFTEINKLFKDLKYEFIIDKYCFKGFQEVYKKEYNYEEIIGYCVSISLFLCHMYYLLKDELHKYYKSNEIQLILHKILYDEINKRTLLINTNKNMFMKFFNNYNCLLGNYSYFMNTFSLYNMVKNDLFDFDMFNERYKILCKYIE